MTRFAVRDLGERSSPGTMVVAGEHVSPGQRGLTTVPTPPLLNRGTCRGSNPRGRPAPGRPELSAKGTKLLSPGAHGSTLLCSPRRSATRGPTIVTPYSAWSRPRASWSPWLRQWPDLAHIPVEADPRRRRLTSLQADCSGCAFVKLCGTPGGADAKPPVASSMTSSPTWAVTMRHLGHRSCLPERRECGGAGRSRKQGPR